MTSKDKPTRGGGKPSGRDKKSFAAASKPGGPKPFRKGPPKAERSEDSEKASARPAGARGDKPFGAKGGKSFRAKPGTARPRGPARPPLVMTETAMAAEGAPKPERISKLLARAGIASRRDVERMIMEGRVRLNGAVLETPVVNATLMDRIEVDGQPIRGIERTRLWIYHKPAGLVTTNSDPEGRPTVFDNLPEELPRVLSIGRLDINTEGLLLLTNDGGLARVLELPATGWLRRYRVRAHGEIDQPALDRLKEGIAVDGVLYGGIDATLDRKQGHNVWLTMGLREGKNREIKNVLGVLGLEVNRLIRLSYGPFQLGELAEGSVVEVRSRMLREQLGPRLIEEAKANFDAPIYNDAPREQEENVEADEKPSRGPVERTERPHREKTAERPERFERSERGERPRGAKPFGSKPFGKGAFRGADRSEDEADVRPKRKTPGSSRTVNVWMAPGAKPVGEKEAARRKRIPTPNARPVTASPDLKGPRVTVTRAAEDGDWIRAESFGGKEKDEGGFGRKRGLGDRTERARSDRPRNDRPRGDRPAGDRAKGDWPREDRPREERPRGERPRDDRPRDERPRGERSFGDRPAGKSFGGGKAFGGKPGGGRSFGGKPGGGRPSGGGRPGSGGRKPRG